MHLPVYYLNYKMHGATIQISPTCFGRHSGNPQGDVIIQEYKNTNLITLVTKAPQ